MTRWCGETSSDPYSIDRQPTMLVDRLLDFVGMGGAALVMALRPPYYVRGALVVHGPREEVGDEDFFEILPELLSRDGGGYASTADPIDVAKDVSDKKSDKLFDAWRYSETSPPPPQRS